MPFHTRVHITIGDLKICLGKSVACLSCFLRHTSTCALFPRDEQYNSRVEWKRFADFNKLQFVTRQDEREGCARLTASFALSPQQSCCNGLRHNRYFISQWLTHKAEATQQITVTATSTAWNSCLQPCKKLRLCTILLRCKYTRHKRHTSWVSNPWPSSFHYGAKGHILNYVYNI